MNQQHIIAKKHKQTNTNKSKYCCVTGVTSNESYWHVSLQIYFALQDSSRFFSVSILENVNISSKVFAGMWSHFGSYAQQRLLTFFTSNLFHILFMFSLLFVISGNIIKFVDMWHLLSRK